MCAAELLHTSQAARFAIVALQPIMDANQPRSAGQAAKPSEAPETSNPAPNEGVGEGTVIHSTQEGALVDETESVIQAEAEIVLPDSDPSGQGVDEDLESDFDDMIISGEGSEDSQTSERISSVPTGGATSGQSIDPTLPVPNDPSGPGLAQATALSAYMSQLRHHAPITREEEHELAVRWIEEGDVEAAKLLVLSNLRLVVKIAMEYRRAWTNTLDLIQEGNVGLMEAVQRFDPYQGVKLSSYAVYWIRAYILKYILDNMRSVRLGTTRASRKLFFRLNKEKRELERLGYEVEPRLLAERLEVSEDDVIDMEARLSRPDVSFDAPLRADDGDGMTFGDRMIAPGISSEMAVGGNQLREVFLGQISAFAESLNERDQQILDERVLAEEPRTLADLGAEFDVSRERVRQLEAKIINRLRAFMKENLVDFEHYGPDAP
jgi:RNA polymerase sigma-32 factor